MPVPLLTGVAMALVSRIHVLETVPVTGCWAHCVPVTGQPRLRSGSSAGDPTARALEALRQAARGQTHQQQEGCGGRRSWDAYVSTFVSKCLSPQAPFPKAELTLPLDPRPSDDSKTVLPLSAIRPLSDQPSQADT